MRRLLSLCFLFLAAACATNQSIVTNVNEREANEIVVFLASRGIAATKMQMPVSNIGAGNSTALLFSISVPEHQSTGAMALLNQYGLPRLKGTTLLELFAKSGLMSSDKEETVRYQAGVSEELKNTICKMDGVLDADVQVSYPSTENATPGAPTGRVTASVYVKHQGVLEDPNSHLEEKIKRLMAGSIPGLDYDSVSVISDRARLADIALSPQRGEFIGGKSAAQPYAQIWSITMTENSLGRFRWIFFSLISLVLLMGGALGWVIYRAYPNLPFLKKKEPPSSES